MMGQTYWYFFPS